MTILNAATPGPWRAKTERVIVAQVSYIDDRGRERFYDKEIAWMQPIGSTVLGSRKANARLIAAAPELLQAAQEAKILIGARNDTLSEAVQQANINQAWHILNAAIANATGVAS